MNIAPHGGAVLTIGKEVRALDSNVCGQGLYENGILVGLCIQPYGSEHDHSDKTATEAIEAGVAVRA